MVRDAAENDRERVICPWDLCVAVTEKLMAIPALLQLQGSILLMLEPVMGNHMRRTGGLANASLSSPGSGH